jgi:heptosyltransferase III
VRRFVGLNYKRDYHAYRELPQAGGFESEAHRLLRNLHTLPVVSFEDAVNWSLNLSQVERSSVQETFSDWPGANHFVAASIGTKIDVKDWGESNWTEWVKGLTRARSDLGLLLVGSADEFEQSQRLAKHWRGPVLNLCGKLTARGSACALEMAEVFVGHDSGPMHLAASVGTPCIAIFSAHAKPGVWFPHGNGHVVFYHKTECFGCGLSRCVRHQKKCIAAIRPDAVLEATLQLLRNNQLQLGVPRSVAAEGTSEVR